MRCAFVIEPLPQGFSLGATVCSYGFSMLAPNVWRAPSEVLAASARAAGRRREGELQRPLRRSDGSALLVVLRQPSARRLEVLVPRGSGRLSALDAATMREQVVRMLRLSPIDTVVARSFASANADLASAGPVGRLFRSPSLFEDLVKTFTLCNCGWGRTLSMNEKLCSKLGGGAFPSASELSGVSTRWLRRHCGVGYRAERLKRLASAVAGGELDLTEIEEAGKSVDEVRQRCSAIYGLGPFGVANALQLLGHYGDVPADSETARHLQQARGKRSCTLQNVREVASRVYKPYAPLQFLRYWTELWRTYEDRMGGLASEVDPEQYKLLTAAHMEVKRQAYPAHTSNSSTARRRKASPGKSAQLQKRPRRIS